MYAEFSLQVRRYGRWQLRYQAISVLEAPTSALGEAIPSLLDLERSLRASPTKHLSSHWKVWEVLEPSRQVPQKAKNAACAGFENVSTQTETSKNPMTPSKVKFQPVPNEAKTGESSSGSSLPRKISYKLKDQLLKPS